MYAIIKNKRNYQYVEQNNIIFLNSNENVENVGGRAGFNVYFLSPKTSRQQAMPDNGLKKYL